MDYKDFSKLSKQASKKIAQYLRGSANGMVIRKTLRFIDGNFRAQGWQGATFNAWARIDRKGTKLVKTGALRRSFNYTGAGAGAVRFYSNVPYSGVHNRGFSGTVNIKAHTRSKYAKSKIYAINDFNRNGTRKSKTVTNKIGQTMVKAHTRKVTIIQRQFAPYDGNESPVLNNSIIRELNLEINKILKL